MAMTDHFVPIYYATRDGQSRRIAAHIGAYLALAGVRTSLSVAGSPPSAEEFEGYPLVVLIAAVRYGRHLAEANLFLAGYRALSRPPPLALASVNLTARKADKRTAEANPYLSKWLRREKISPVLATAFAGRLDYPLYRRCDRLAIRLIMLLTGGETDPTATVEYTSWRDVDAFAEAIAASLRVSDNGGRVARPGTTPDSAEIS